MDYGREKEIKEEAYKRLGEAVQLLTRKFYARFNSQLMPGLSGSQLLVLKIINQRGRLTVSELAENLGVSLSAVTALVDRLNAQGLVVRHRDGGDRRLVFVESTPAGRAMVQEVIDRHKKIMACCFDKTPASEIEQIVKTLEKLVDIISGDDCKIG